MAEISVWWGSSPLSPPLSVKLPIFRKFSVLSEVSKKLNVPKFRKVTGARGNLYVDLIILSYFRYAIYSARGLIFENRYK